MNMKLDEKIIDRQIVKDHLAGIEPTPKLSLTEKRSLRQNIKKLLQQKNATIIAHYYVDADLQELAEECGGFVGDSLDMARFGKDSEADMLVVVGVKFMGETAKIINPKKTVLMPSLKATCSLDLSCPAPEFDRFCSQHPDRTVVVYANTSAEVKARADWVVTSSIAAEVIEHLHSKGEKIIWAPDKHLGSYLQRATGADMLLWDGSCIVHEEFRAKGLAELKAVHPDAAVLAHPESPAAVLEQADVVGSTSRLIKSAQEMDNNIFIVATDMGIFHKMRQLANRNGADGYNSKDAHTNGNGAAKDFIPAPTAGNGATCRSCAHCPWMAMNSLRNLEQCLEAESNEIVIAPEVVECAQTSIMRMMNFSRQTS